MCIGYIPCSKLLLAAGYDYVDLSLIRLLYYCRPMGEQYWLADLHAHIVLYSEYCVIAIVFVLQNQGRVEFSSLKGKMHT